MEYQLDMSMMFAMHDALRRELVQVARLGRRTGDHPGQQLRGLVEPPYVEHRRGPGQLLP